MKRKITPDLNKAKSLFLMAQKTLDRLKSFNKSEYPSNTIEDYYSILHQLMEALSSIKGFKFSGESSHKELIDYISKEFSLSESDAYFLQELRSYRNRISYEGFFISVDYLKRNELKIENLIKLFRNKILNELNIS